MEEVVRNGAEFPKDRALAILRQALPFSLVRRGRKIVGCWYMSDARPYGDHEGHDAPEVLGARCRAMIRTEDGRVVGLNHDMAMLPDLEEHREHMVRTMSAASKDLRAAPRRRMAEAFVENLREAVDGLDRPWTTMRRRQALFKAHLIDGYKGWRADDDEVATLKAMMIIDVGRVSVLRRFVDTLDPILVSALRPHDWQAAHTDELDGLLGEAWPLLDVTFGRGAPLRACMLPFLDDHAMAGRILRDRLHRPRNADDHDLDVGPAGPAITMRDDLPTERVDLTNVADLGFQGPD